MKKFRVTVIAFVSLITTLTGCEQVALYERLQNIEKAAWSEQQVPSFTFDITDTTINYNVYVVVRHTNTYSYRNIWLNIGLQQPGDTVRQQPFELQLAAIDSWLGTGMDDVFEHRALLFSKPVHFSKPGPITFTLQQIMRQNPLPGIMQVGVRVEPVK
ncbi:MAG: gliding motility lipoprotein GldH [Bacteroidota bacterium]